MENEYPVKEETLDLEAIDAMEERRISMLDGAGIDEQAVLANANEHLNIWNSYFNENIVRGKDDMNFTLRDQWTAIERSEFTRLFKPAMTFNKLYDATKKITGEQRKNKPDLLVRSLTGKATQEQINLRADLVRTISYQSQNDLVYQTAFKSALLMGFGAYQIAIDYESANSFNRIIKLEMIPDSTRTFFDPRALKPHKGDGDWCARNVVMGRAEFEATYPYVTNPVSFIDPFMLLDFQWETKDSIVICDYFVKEWFPLIIHKLSDGRTVKDYQWEEMQEQFEQLRELAEGSETKRLILQQIPTITSTRQTQDYRIMHYRMIRNQILDFIEWPSKHLPIIFVDGDSSFIEGRQYTKSFVHEARDAQKCVNYFGSEIAAEIKNRRREQWMATPDNIIGYEQQWRNPELQMGALMAKPDPKTGAMPMKQPQWDLSPALMVNMQRAGQDIKEIMGFSESEEVQGRDISGKARRERKLEGSMSATVFFSNLNQAIEQGGRVILDLLPYVYGGDERNVVISKKDGQTKNMVLNKVMKDETIENAMDAGEYDLEIDTGPSYAVQKDVALEFLAQTIQAFPQSFPLVADLWAKNLDVQFGPQISERFKTMVPPDILAKEAGEPPPPPQPDPQQMMMQQQMEMAKNEMMLKQKDIEIKMQKLEMEREKNELDRAELMLKAQKIQTDTQLDIYNHEANIEKARITHDLHKDKSDLDFSAKISAILADIHKHNNPHEKSSIKQQSSS